MFDSWTLHPFPCLIFSFKMFRTGESWRTATSRTRQMDMPLSAPSLSAVPINLVLLRPRQPKGPRIRLRPTARFGCTATGEVRCISRLGIVSRPAVLSTGIWHYLGTLLATSGRYSTGSFRLLGGIGDYYIEFSVTLSSGLRRCVAEDLPHSFGQIWRGSAAYFQAVLADDWPCNFLQIWFPPFSFF